MRTVLLVAGCSGCLIAEPEGAQQAWPPPLGGTVQAVANADLDANGSTDLVIASTGNANNAGLYHLVGNSDIVLGGPDAVRSFTQFYPRAIAAPTAALGIEGASPGVVLASIVDGSIELTKLDTELVERTKVETQLPGAMTMWMRPLSFPGGMPRVAISNGSQLNTLHVDLNDEKPLPPPAGGMWNGAQVAMSYAQSFDQIMVVATATEIHRAQLPMPGGQFTWSTVRTGAMWLGQTAADVDGDTRDEIIGFDIAAHAVCIADVDAATLPVTPSCLPLGTNFPGNEVTILVGNVTSNIGSDIMVAQATGTETSFSLVEDFSYSGGVLSAPMKRPLPIVGPPRGRSVSVSGGPGAPTVVLVFGTDGVATCVQGPC